MKSDSGDAPAYTALHAVRNTIADLHLAGAATIGPPQADAECAPQAHPTLLAAPKAIQPTIDVGKDACARYLADEFDSATAASRACNTLLPMRPALPQPSPRNNLWLKKHAWFEHEALAAIRDRVRAIAA